MILRVEGPVTPTYCQNLCLIYFPGAKFPTGEAPGPGVPEAFVAVSEADGTLTASVVLQKDGQTARGASSGDAAGFVSRDRAVKTVVGEAFLQAGKALFGFLPPFGILTGVRPTKISAEMRRRGLDRDGIAAALEKEFHVRPDKAALLTEVTERQAPIVSLAGPGTCSLYVSIPFCPTRCAYCSFVSYATPRYLATIPAYLDRLCEDIRRTGREIAERGEKLLTVYVGGGTPTILDAGQLDRLLTVIRESAAPAEPLEFTVEAGRPDTITAEKCRVMLSHGVTRTSINPQILDDEVLRLIGRDHTVADFFRAFEIARRAGLPINTDLIAGLPGANADGFCRTVDRILSLEPENVTVHAYCVKRSASFSEEAAEKGDPRGIYARSEGAEESVDYAERRLAGAGYHPYYLYRQKNARGNLENVGFSRPGHDCLYNVFIMEEVQTIHAVGAGAVSKRVGAPGEKIERIFEPKYTYEYLSKPDRC